MPLLPKLISLKFRFWVFASMVMVVFIHAYNLNIRSVRPWTLPQEPLTLTTFTEYFLSNGIFRFVVPLLFLMSGYLYSLHDGKPYWQRIKKRLRVLLIPYLIWSAAGMALIYLLMSFPSTRIIATSSHVLPETNSRLIHSTYHWYDFFIKWILLPVPYQLWFIRVLIIYNLAYPLLRWCIMHKIIRFIFFSALVFLWITTFNAVYIEGEGLLFFSIGIWLQKTNFNIESPSKFLNPFAWLIVFIIICTAKTALAFTGYFYLGNKIFVLLEVMQKITIFSGLIGVWYSTTGIVMRFMNKKWFVWLSAFSFIIYVMHAPAVAIGISSFFELLHYMQGYRILTYILLPFVIIVASIVFGALMRKLFPQFYSILTGARGV